MKADILILSLFLLMFGACTPGNLRKEPTGKQKVAHVRIYWTEDPSSHAHISWTSMQKGEDHFVVYDTVSHANQHPRKYAFRNDNSKDGKITMTAEDRISGVPEAYYHHVAVSGLKEHTKYYFRACSDSHCSDEYYLLTARSSGNNLKVLFGGDSRIGTIQEEDNTPSKHQARKKMNRLIAKIVADNPDIMALIHGADYGMRSTWKYLYHWFNDHELTITPDGRILPLIISKGNHDHQIGFNENFYLGDVSDRNADGYYYTTTFTNQIALITLNTETSMAGYQYQWLKKELKTLRSSNTWLLVQYHKPAYPAVKSFDREDFERVRKYWVPLFEEHHIDLALESDGHALKYTIPIKENAPHPEGIIYIGEGGLGVPQRKTDNTRWYFQNGGHASSHHHVWLLELDALQMNAFAIGENGDTIVSFNRTVRKQP
jgi:hypothetical protein